MNVYVILDERNKIIIQKSMVDTEGVLKEIVLLIHIRSQRRKKALQQFVGTPWEMLVVIKSVQRIFFLGC